MKKKSVLNSKLLKRKRSILKEMKRMKRLLHKNLNPKKLTPKSIRRLKNTRKIVKSVQKHQNIYLNGLYTMVYGVGRFFKKP